MLAFGVGRRICPGRHFVDATLFMVAASVLSVFNVMKVKGDTIPVKSRTARVGEVVMWVICRSGLSFLGSDWESFEDIRKSLLVLLLREMNLQRIASLQASWLEIAC
jgi:Cytochrome P450